MAWRIPSTHARASVHYFGGTSTDYLALHEWLDQTKMALADCRHRLVLHNTWGLEVAISAWGEHYLVASTGCTVPVRALVTRHIVEDLGCTPTLADCLPEDCVPPCLHARDEDLARELDDASVAEHAERTARRFGGRPGDYLEVHTFLDSAKREVPDWRHRLPTHHTLGPYLAAAVFGTTLRRASDGVEVPTRPLAEGHIIDDLGRIPTLAECLRKVQLWPWMCQRALPLSRLYGRETPPPGPTEVGHKSWVKGMRAMKLRRLTDAEIRLVVNEHLAVRDWERHVKHYRRFADDVFGPRAAIIILGLGLVYNDEGTEPGVATVAAYDAERNALPPRPEPWAWEGHALAGSSA